MIKVKDVISLLSKLDPELQVVEPAVFEGYCDFHLYRITQITAVKGKSPYWAEGEWKECPEGEPVVIIN